MATLSGAITGAAPAGNLTATIRGSVFRILRTGTNVVPLRPIWIPRPIHTRLGVR